MLGRNVMLDVTPVEVRGGSGRAPLRILALDGDDNTLTLTFFNNPAWAEAAAAQPEADGHRQARYLGQ